MQIVSLNTWLLPPPFSTANSARIEEIISYIKTVQPDVIALQEVWLTSYVEQFKHELSQYKFLETSDTFLNTTGLLTGFRDRFEPVTNTRYPRTLRHNPVEHIAYKGYHTARFHDIHLLNTHLYSPKTRDTQRIPEQQFDRVQDEARDETMIVVGDLNLDLEAVRTLNETFQTPPQHGPTVTEANPYTADSTNAQLDHVLTTPELDRTVSTETRTEPVLSDHYAVLAHFT